MKRQLSILLVIAFMLSLTSAIAIANEVPFGATVTDLIADGGSPETAMTVGEVQVWNDAEYLYVQYMVTAPWCLTKTHLHVAESLDMVPQTKKGNPKPGLFAIQALHECVQMSNEAIEPFVITETAWGAGGGFPGKNWATYFNHTVREPEQCDDGMDNDCDGDTDCADSDCVESPLCTPPCFDANQFSGIGQGAAGEFETACELTAECTRDHPAVCDVSFWEEIDECLGCILGFPVCDVCNTRMEPMWECSNVCVIGII
jgi:hypothetical protein